MIQNLADILKQKQDQLKKDHQNAKPKRGGGNPNWQEAEMFGKYVGLNTLFVLKLFRVYGKNKVLNLQSWLKDVPNLDKSRYVGLVIWKLKGGVYKNR